MEHGNRRFQRTTFAAFLLILLTCSWFFSVGHVNQISRYDAMFSFYRNTGENAWTFRIDDCWTNTPDWALCDGHYYSNKSPGTTLLGIVVLAPARVARLIASGREAANRFTVFDAWLTNWLLSVLPVALSFFAFLGVFRMIGLSELRALFGAALGVLGTALFPYSTTLFAHASVAAFLVISLYFGMRATRICSPWSLVACGAFYGLAALFDYSALILLPIVAAAALWRFRMRALWLFAGGVPFALAYCLYNLACFGSPFSFAFQYNNPIFVTEESMGGTLNEPSWQIFLQLLVGAKRGILPAMPFLLFAIPGGIHLWKTGRRALTLLLGVCAAAIFLMNASFNGWHGGATTLARYLIPILPALTILSVASPLKSGAARWSFLLLALLSCCNMFAVAQYATMAYERDASPLYGTAYATMFDVARPQTLLTSLDGELLWLKPNPRKEAESAFSLGEKLGLNRVASLLCPMLALTLALLCAAIRFRKAAFEFFLAPLKSWRDILPDKEQAIPAALCLAAFASVLCWPGSIGWSERDAAFLNDNLTPGGFGMELKAADARQWLSPTFLFWRTGLVLSSDILFLAFLKTLLVAGSILWAARKLHSIAGRRNWEIYAFLFFLFPTASCAIRALSAASLSIPFALFGMLLLFKFLQTNKAAWFIASFALFLSTVVLSSCGVALPIAALLVLALRLETFRDFVHRVAVLAVLPAVAAFAAAFAAHRFFGHPAFYEPGRMADAALRLFSLSSFDSIFPPWLEMREDSYPNGYGWGAILSLTMLAIGFLLAFIGSIHAFRRWPSAGRDPWAALHLFSLISCMLTIVLSTFLCDAPDLGAASASLPCLVFLETGGVGWLQRRVPHFRIAFAVFFLAVLIVKFAVCGHFANLRAINAELKPDLAEQHRIAQAINSILERTGAGRWTIEDAPENATPMQAQLDALVKLDAFRTPRWNVTAPGRTEILRIRAAEPGRTAKLSLEVAPASPRH